MCNLVARGSFFFFFFTGYDGTMCVCMRRKYQKSCTIDRKPHDPQLKPALKTFLSQMEDEKKIEKIYM